MNPLIMKRLFACSLCTVSISGLCIYDREFAYEFKRTLDNDINSGKIMSNI
jgi:hypothetical protein